MSLIPILKTNTAPNSVTLRQTSTHNGQSLKITTKHSYSQRIIKPPRLRLIVHRLHRWHIRTQLTSYTKKTTFTTTTNGTIVRKNFFWSRTSWNRSLHKHKTPEMLPTCWKPTHHHHIHSTRRPWLFHFRFCLSFSLSLSLSLILPTVNTLFTFILELTLIQILDNTQKLKSKIQ